MLIPKKGLGRPDLIEFGILFWRLDGTKNVGCPDFATEELYPYRLSRRVGYYVRKSSYSAATSTKLVTVSGEANALALCFLEHTFPIEPCLFDLTS